MKRREMIKLTTALTASGFLSKSGLSKPFETESILTDNLIQNSKERLGGEKDWFLENKFGMFVHWGLYAIPAVHEQYQQRYGIPRKQYEQYAKQWNPVNFNPNKWLDLMQEAGMQYLTFTTKHHDGFCMWDTKQTSFNTMNTPYKKDILGMLADACHKRNIPLSLYYSIVDWHHPNYPNQGRHHELSGPVPGDSPNWELYIDFLKAQVKELCSNYGEINGFWWDMNVSEYKDPSINAMIRELQPKIVINNRGFDDGDFGTPERDYNQKSANLSGFNRPTEACQSVGMQSWGYRKEEDYYSDRYLMKSIDSYLARNANYLLNIGPTSKGVFPDVQVKILQGLGKWYSRVKESFINIEPVSDLVDDHNVILTKRGNTLYIHLNEVPIGNSVNLKPIKSKPIESKLLNTNQTVECIVERLPYEKEPFLIIRNLPVNKMADTVLVIKLVFDVTINNLKKQY